MLALLLASIGIYGSIAYMVGQRTREIGVRLALGATPAGVFRAVLGNGLALMSAGVAAGLPCAFAVMPVLRGFLAGVESYDPATFASLSAILFAVAVVACLVPARRAMRLDPVAALRLE